MSAAATVAAVRGGADPDNEPLALRVPLLCHGHSRRRRWSIRCVEQTPVRIAEGAGEQLQEQEVEHVGQRQAFCNREKGGVARVVCAR